jgi:hypothetical protein
LGLVLKGAKPADIPIKQPTKFDLPSQDRYANFSVPQTIMIAPTRSSNELRFFRNCRLCLFGEASVRCFNWRPPSFQTKPAMLPIGTSLQLVQCGDMQKLI